jgi:type I restriction enzyme, S subunit
MLSTLQQDLPKGWILIPLGEVVTFNYGKGLRSDIRDSSGGIPVYGSNGIVGYHNKHLIDQPCIVIGRKGAAGKVHLSKVPSWPIDTTYYVIPPEEIEIKYLYYLLSILNLESLDKSTAIPGLNRNDAYNILIPIAPKLEQIQIVSKIEELLSELDAGVAALKRVQANLKRYKASLLKAACEGRLVPTEAELARREERDFEPASVLLERILKERRAKWEQEQRAKGKDPNKMKYPEPKTPDTEGLPELPEGWCWATVDQIAKVGTGATPLRSKQKYWKGGTIPWVTSGLLNDLHIYKAHENITDIALKETNSKIFSKGTLLVAMYGEGKTRGKVSELMIEAATNQACAAITISNYIENLKPFLKLFFLKNYEDIRILSSGGVQPNLNLSIIKNTLIPLPPLLEQDRIISEIDRKMSVIEEISKQLFENFLRVDRLQRTILAKAFSGLLSSNRSYGENPLSSKDEEQNLLLY